MKADLTKHTTLTGQLAKSQGSNPKKTTHIFYFFTLFLVFRKQHCHADAPFISNKITKL